MGADSDDVENIGRDECLKKGAQHVFRYVSRDLMKATISKETSEASPESLETGIQVGFVCVPSRVIEESKSDSNIDKFIKYTNARTQVILFTMPGTVHEFTVRNLERNIVESLAKSGISSLFGAGGSLLAPVESTDRQQQSDVSFYYVDQLSNCPQIVAEVGTTQRPRDLLEHAQFWAIHEEVRLLLTVEVRGRCETFHLCQWGPRNDNPFTKEGEIIVSRVNGHYAVTSDSDDYLATPFRKLLDRDPVPERGEKDFVITRDQVLKMARLVDSLVYHRLATTNNAPHHVDRSAHSGWGGKCRS